MESRVPEEKYNAKGLLMWIVMMVVVVAFIVIMTLVRNLPYEEFTVYDKGLFTTGFTFIIDVTIYYLVKLIFKNRNAPKGLTIVITTLSSTVFGVFLIENIIRDIFMPIYYSIADVIGKYLGCWVYVVIAFVICAAIIYVIKLIPGVKKIL